MGLLQDKRLIAVTLKSCGKPSFRQWFSYLHLQKCMPKLHQFVKTSEETIYKTTAIATYEVHMLSPSIILGKSDHLAILLKPTDTTQLRGKSVTFKTSKMCSDNAMTCRAAKRLWI